MNLLRVKKSIFVLLFCSLFFSSCKTLNKGVTLNELVKKASPEAQTLLDKPEFTTCKSGKNKNFNDILLKCNLWGKRKVKKSEPKLCTFKKDDFWGWKWDVPKNASGVIGYPALQLGYSPFGKITKKKNNLPVKVSQINTLEVTYDFETVVKHKKFNLAFDIWLTNKEFSEKENITTEIMIWEDYNSFTSYGKKQETILTPFGVYTVYEGYLKNDNFQQDWRYVAFVREKDKKRNSGTVDVKFFLDYLVRVKLISEEYYLTTLELGNEIGNSSGFTLVKNFEWNLQLD